MHATKRLSGTILGILFVVFVATGVVAQSRSDGSIYSRFGIGERQHFLSGQSQAMGGAGLALNSYRYVNSGNPASWFDQQFLRAGGSATFQRVREEADGYDTSTLGSGQFNAIQIGFPLYSRKTGVSFSFRPHTRVNYNVTSLRSHDPGTGDAEIPYSVSFRGNGGIQKLSGGVGHLIGRRVSLGASLDYLFGILEQSQTSEFGSDAYTDRTIVSGTRLRGVSGTFGASFAVIEPGVSGNALLVSAVFSFPASLAGNRVRTLGTGETADTLGRSESGDVRLPLSAGLGVAWKPNPRWIIVADGLVETWSSFESDFTFPGYDPSDPSGLDDRVRLSAGAEYWPGSRRPFAGFLTRTAYRMGVYTDVDYVSPDPTHKIRSIGVTGGVSLPSRIPGTTLDLNIDVGRRGTTEDGLIRDRYIRFGLNLNFGERWFDRLPLG